MNTDWERYVTTSLLLLLSELTIQYLELTPTARLNVETIYFYIFDSWVKTYPLLIRCRKKLKCDTKKEQPGGTWQGTSHFHCQLSYFYSVLDQFGSEKVLGDMAWYSSQKKVEKEHQNHENIWNKSVEYFSLFHVNFLTQSTESKHMWLERSNFWDIDLDLLQPHMTLFAALSQRTFYFNALAQCSMYPVTILQILCSQLLFNISLSTCAPKI